MTPARIRFWLNGVDDTDLCETYLGAVLRSGIAPVRAISFTPGALTQDRWKRLHHIFEAEVADRYVNVVCAWPRDRTVSGMLALEALTRDGARNVAITFATQNIIPEVVDALNQYDVIFTGSVGSIGSLRAAGVRAPIAHVMPGDAAQHLQPYVEELSR